MHASERFNGHHHRGRPVNQRNFILAAAGVLLVGLIVAVLLRVSSQPPADRLPVAGDVRVVQRVVTAPSITYATPNVTVGIPSTQTASPGSGKRPSPQPARSNAPVVSGTIARMYVQTGQHIEAGATVAQLDTTLLKLGVAQAKADADRARANVAVLRKTLDSLASAQNKLVTARSTAFATAFSAIDAAIANAIAPIYKKHADAVKARPQLAAAIAGIEAALAHLPPNDPQVPGLKAKLAGLKKNLAGIDAFLKQWPTIKKKLASQTATAKATAKAKAGALINTKIGQAQSKITDAKTKVKNARDVLKIVADSQQVAIDLAEARVAQATILSPYSGYVTMTAQQGSVAMVGAPIVRIQPDGPVEVNTYLTGQQLARVRVGSPADVTYDSAKGTVLHGVVSVVGSIAQFPPTSFPTDIVHMTKTIPVTIRLDSGSPPPGTPVDIVIHTDGSR